MRNLGGTYFELARDKEGELIVSLKRRIVGEEAIITQELGSVPFEFYSDASTFIKVHSPIVDQIVICRKEANHADEFLAMFPQEALITITHMPIGVVLHLTYPRKDVPVASIHQLRRSLARRKIGSLDV